MKSYYLLIFSLFLFGCNPNDVPVNILSGKIKTLEIIYPDGNDTSLFYYNYSNSGYLTGLISDSVKFNISDNVAGIITVTNTVIDADPLFSGTVKYKVYTNPEKQVIAINLLDTLNRVEIPEFRMAYSSNVLDTLTDLGARYFAHDISNYNYEFDGNNYVSQKALWQTWEFPFYDVDYKGTLTYTYSSLLNDNGVPLQIQYLSRISAITGDLTENLFLYLMEQNGYASLKKNKNLIQSVTYHDQAVFFPSEYHDHITNFDYIQNSSGQVSEMHVSNPDGTGTFMIYKMTYY